MILRINNVIVSEPSGGIMERINDFADWFISEEADVLLKPATNTLTDFATRFLDVVNACSAEIITLAIVMCAVGMMVAPITGGGGGKWTGRLFVTFWGGVIWRMLT